MLTTQQVRDRTKTVTRRCGWWFLKPGDRLQGCVKCQGIKKGEKMEKLAVIEVVSTRPEKLWEMQEEDCPREGFPDMHPHEFVEMFCDNMGVGPDEVINRIEFKYVDEDEPVIRPIPDAIVAEMDRHYHEDFEDGRLAPSYCEFLQADGQKVFCKFQDMTVGRFEQATEYHIQQARKKLASYAKKPTPIKTFQAAWHIIRARVYRSKYHFLMGLPTTESDLPFPNDTY